MAAEGRDCISRHRRHRVGLLLCMLCTVTMAAGEDRTRLVDVGGHALRIDCRGHGTPAIILDAGLGGSAGDWTAVQEALAGEHEVCVYDRAGYGDSVAGPAPRSSARIAAELRTLLERAGIAPPYVLGGHSFGGFNLRVFAGLFPRDVAGLVLVDPPHERLDGVLEGVLLGSVDPGGMLGALWRSGQLAAFVDALAPLATVLGLDLPAVRVIASELEAFPQSAEEARAAELAPRLPLIVIVHGRRVLPPGAFGDRLEREWLDLLKRLACTHPHGRYRVAAESGHMVMAEQPALVASALREAATATSPAALAQERALSCPGAGADALRSDVGSGPPLRDGASTIVDP